MHTYVFFKNRLYLGYHLFLEVSLPLILNLYLKIKVCDRVPNPSFWNSRLLIEN